MNFEPVSTLADLRSLDDDEIVEGYLSYLSGDPEPGPNRGRSFWHGWRNGAIDAGDIPIDDAARELASQWMSFPNPDPNRTDGG